MPMTLTETPEHDQAKDAADTPTEAEQPVLKEAQKSGEGTSGTGIETAIAQA